MSPKPTKGGARPGSGRPQLVAGQPTKAVQVRLDPDRIAAAEKIGEGSIAEGVRRALDAHAASLRPAEK